MRQSATTPAPNLHVVPHSAATQGPFPLSRTAFRLLAAAAICLGLLVRASFVFSSDFPLNDGGMFFQMTRDLQANNYALPAATSYNAAGIPFAYPPLGFYLAGAMDSLTPMSLIDAFRLLPLAADTALLAAFLLLARRFLSARAAVLVALTIFALLPPSFTWMLMGGGVARAVGFVFALLVIRQADVMFTEPRRWQPVVVGGLAALTLASHLEMAWFAAVTCAVLLVGRGASRRSAVDATIAAALAVALSAPWWGTVVAMHGVTPFVAAARAGGGSPLILGAHLLQFRVTAEPLFAVFGALGLLGMLTCVARRQYLLPAWVIACAALDPRAFPTSGSVPVAILAAIALHDVVLPLVNQEHARHHTARWLAPALIAGLNVYGFLGAMLYEPERLSGMSRDERDAMAWARDDTPANATFAVVSGDAWPIDRTSEWFPALTGHKSVGTVQGYEWFPGKFRSRIDRYMELQDCAVDGVACLDAWTTDSGEDFDYVYIPKLAPIVDAHADDDCCGPLVRELRTDARYQIAFDGPGAVIFSRE